MQNFGVLKWDETVYQVDFAPGKTGKSRHIYVLDTSVTNQIKGFVRSTISAKTVSIFSFSIKQEIFVQTVTTGTRASSAIFPGVFHLPVGRSLQKKTVLKAKRNFSGRCKREDEVEMV